DAIGNAAVDVDPVVLPRPELVEEVPRLPDVVRLVHAAVGAEEKAVALGGIDDERVAVGVDFLEGVLTQRLPPRVGDVHKVAEEVAARVELRIDAHLAEIERPRVERVHAGPRAPGVVRAENAAALRPDTPRRAALLVGLHDGVDDARVLREDGKADTPGVVR